MGTVVSRGATGYETVSTSAQVRDIVRILTEIGESKRYMSFWKRMATVNGNAQLGFEPPEPPSGTTWERDLVLRSTRPPFAGWRLRIQIQDHGDQREVSFEVRTNKLLGGEKQPPHNAMAMMVAALPA